MKRKSLRQYNVIQSDYAEERIQDKLEYIRRTFKSEQAFKHLENEIENVEYSLSKNAKINSPHIDDNREEYRYAFVNVGEGYYLLYHIDENTVVIDDCIHKRELRETP